MREDRVAWTIEKGIADVRLNRPEKMNALDPAMIEAIMETASELRQAPGVRVVVLSGVGKSFCAGLDRELFARMAAGQSQGFLNDLRTRTHGLANAAQHLAYAWRELPFPVIAAIHGAAFGGGFQIVLGADIRYVAPDAKLSLLEVKWGIIPDMAGFALMRSLARSDHARELAMTGRIFSGAEAAGYGLATAIHSDPHAAAMRTAAEIAGRSPDAVRAIKRLMNASEDADAAEILIAESVEQTALIGSVNQVEAVRAALENRPPQFVDPD